MGVPWHGVRQGGALEFVINAWLNHGVTKLGFFGYSHGGGSVRLLVEALAIRANEMADGGNEELLNLLANNPIFQDPEYIQVPIFWTACIDAVRLYYSNGDPHGNGRTPETEFPIEPVPYDIYFTPSALRHSRRSERSWSSRC